MWTRIRLMQAGFGLVLAALGALGAAGIDAKASAAEPGAHARFEQDRFAIGFWVDPPADDRMTSHYQKIADAHFTLVIGGFGARTPEHVLRQLDLCEQYDLRAIVAQAGLPPDELPTSPALWGYMVRDEPHARDFPGLRETVDSLRQSRPGALAFINLFPSYASKEQLGTETYEEHVAQYMAEVQPDVLSMDHYPHMRPDRDTRGAYCADLDVMRRHSLEAGVPFWNFFNIMPFGPHFDPTEAQVRWQVFTSLAYGAKGVLYFCYWTPQGREFPKGGAIITTDGRQTRHYDEAKRLNFELKNWGPTLMQLTSTGVYRVTNDDDPAETLAGSPIRSLSRGEYLVGAFNHADGRRAVLLNNYRHAYTAWPTVTFDAAHEDIREVDPATGHEVPLRDDSPAMDGLQISLAAGSGRLFLLP